MEIFLRAVHSELVPLSRLGAVPGSPPLGAAGVTHLGPVPWPGTGSWWLRSSPDAFPGSSWGRRCLGSSGMRRTSLGWNGKQPKQDPGACPGLRAPRSGSCVSIWDAGEHLAKIPVQGLAPAQPLPVPMNPCGSWGRGGRSRAFIASRSQEVLRAQTIRKRR